jgi:hypothetical protein
MRACASRTDTGPLFQTTWSAREIFSESGICESIMARAAEGVRCVREIKRCRWISCPQATTTTRSHNNSPWVS